jgi:hypothetical protein
MVREASFLSASIVQAGKSALTRFNVRRFVAGESFTKFFSRAPAVSQKGKGAAPHIDNALPLWFSQIPLALLGASSG